MANAPSTTFVLIALGANVGIAVAKFAAATWTNSSAMLSEAIHSLVDTSNQALLLLGLRRSQRPADASHPFGYSKEIYFWGFVVAVLLFSMGAGVSIYEGVHKLLEPHPISDPHVNYIVLGIALALEGYSTYRAVGELKVRHANQGLIDALRKSKDAALFTVVMEDIAAMTGLTLALAESWSRIWPGSTGQTAPPQLRSDCCWRWSLYSWRSRSVRSSSARPSLGTCSAD